MRASIFALIFSIVGSVSGSSVSSVLPVSLSRPDIFSNSVFMIFLSSFIWLVKLSIVCSYLLVVLLFSVELLGLSFTVESLSEDSPAVLLSPALFTADVKSVIDALAMIFAIAS